MTQRIYAIFTAVLASVMLWHSGGCLALAPGGQVKEALEQKGRVEWLADGSLTIVGEGAQTQAFTMATGELAMTIGPDGKPMLDVANSHIDAWLQFDPSAQSAENAMLPAFEASTRQIEMLSAMWRDTFGLLMSMVPAQSGIPPPPTAVGLPTAVGSQGDGG